MTEKEFQVNADCIIICSATEHNPTLFMCLGTSLHEKSLPAFALKKEKRKWQDKEEAPSVA